MFSYVSTIHIESFALKIVLVKWRKYNKQNIHWDVRTIQNGYPKKTFLQR